MDTKQTQMDTKSCCVKYYCDCCDYGTSRKGSYNKHILTSKHLLTINGHEKVAESCDVKYYCESCDYKTSRKSSYDKHILTPKHVKLQQRCVCNICNKSYSDRSGLFKHKRKCGTQITQTIEVSTNIFMEMMKQNNELTKQVIELASKPTTTNNNTTNNNSFNLQFFLNETCKDALNITDFINQLQVGTKDLEETGRLGYAEGISKIFINGLKKLNVNQRPVHCSDAKRETIYIKDGDQWEKDNDEKIKLTNAIRDVAHKNIEQIQVWTEEHPEYTDLKSKYNDRYMKLIGEAMSGSTNEETYRNYKKIARNIMRETIIPK